MIGFFFTCLPAAAQTSRLPLPVDSPANAQFFEAAGPTAGVLTGFLVPSGGPLTAWAPLFRVLGADGTLGAEQPGAWNGALPSRWIRASRPGMVVKGMRVLMRTGPGQVQTRQLQVFWQAWSNGVASGPIAEGEVLGQAAAEKDMVRIIELRVPDNAVAVGLYGLLFAGSVVQTSLLVRALNPAPVSDAQPGSGPQSPASPGFPQFPGPRAPSAPRLGEPRATPLPNSP